MTSVEYSHLERLLENMDSIQEQLRPWTNDTNIFQILKITNQEIRHSNFLEYLFNPSASHDLNDIFLKRFLTSFYKKNPDIIANLPHLTLFDVMLDDFNDALIYREHQNMDLFIVSEKNNITVCIENKINAVESDHQLNKYRNYVVKEYPEYTNILIFLSPEGIEPTKKEWGIMSYKDIAEILIDIINKEELSPKVKFIVEDYTRTLRRDILMDEELQRICRKIYIEYQEALDLIYEVKPDTVSLLKELYVEALKELAHENKIVFDEKHSGKSLIRFQIKSLTNIFPDLPEHIVSGWNNQKSYFVEIHNNDKAPKIQVSFSSGKLGEAREMIAEKLAEINMTNKSDKWSWWVPVSYRLKPLTTDYINNLLSHLHDDGREVVVSEIKEGIEDAIEKITKRFESLSS